MLRRHDAAPPIPGAPPLRQPCPWLPPFPRHFPTTPPAPNFVDFSFLWICFPFSTPVLTLAFSRLLPAPQSQRRAAGRVGGALRAAAARTDERLGGTRRPRPGGTRTACRSKGGAGVARGRRRWPCNPPRARPPRPRRRHCRSRAPPGPSPHAPRPLGRPLPAAVPRTPPRPPQLLSRHGPCAPMPDPRRPFHRPARR